MNILMTVNKLQVNLSCRCRHWLLWTLNCQAGPCRQRKNTYYSLFSGHIVICMMCIYDIELRLNHSKWPWVRRKYGYWWLERRSDLLLAQAEAFYEIYDIKTFCKVDDSIILYSTSNPNVAALKRRSVLPRLAIMRRYDNLFLYWQFTPTPPVLPALPLPGRRGLHASK